MTRAIGLAAAFSLVCVCAAQAQGGAPTLSSSIKGMFDGVNRNLVEAAEKMPEGEYAFKPTPEVRSFGELVGHVANGNFSYCSAGKGEKNPNAENFEQTTAKTALVNGLKDSVTYCAGIYSAATDAWLNETVKMGTAANPVERLRAYPLIFNVTHDNEHYGNIVTYMRLKGQVPPSTERAQQPRK